MPLLLFVFLLLLPTVHAAEPLSVRFQQVAENAELISNELLSRPRETLSTADWLVLTEAQLRLRNKDAAMDAVNNALLQPADSYLHAYAFLLKAQVYGILFRDTAIAITQLEQAELLLANAEDADSLALYSDVLQNFAQAYNQLGNIPKAIPYAEQSLALALRQQQAEAELKARITLGRLTLQNNNYSQAFVHMNHALALAQRLNDADALASIHLRLGMAYRKIDSHAQALQHLLQAKQRYHELKRPSSYANTLIYLGETYLEDKSTAAQAEQYLTEAITLAKQLDDLPRVGVATMGLGRMAALQGNTDLALSYFNDAVQLFRQQNILTYLQETQLELAELLRKKGSAASQIDALLTEIQPQMSTAAGYLQQRFYDTAARHAASQGRWQQAFGYLEQAMLLRFDQQKDQNKLQLDLIDLGLAKEALAQQLQAELTQQQQLNMQLQRDLYMLLLVIVLLFLLLVAVLIWSGRQQRKKRYSSMNVSADWQKFCQNAMQSEPAVTDILALRPALSMELKQTFGEQPLLEIWRQALQQHASPTLKASCWHDDVLWLAVTSANADINTYNTQLISALQHALPQQFAETGWLSVQFPLTTLRQKAWTTPELTALREAFWLTAALSQEQTVSATVKLVTLHAITTNSCEWRSGMIRQDLLNAIRLGTVQLQINGQIMTATQVDNLY